MPVFVDATGRRRRRMRRIAYSIGAACLTYTGLVVASVAGHPARPGAFVLLPAPADRPLPVVRQIQQPERPTSGVPLPSGDGPQVEAVPMRLQPREPDQPSTPRPPRAPVPPRTESTPLPTPATPAPTEPPAPTDPPPNPEPTDPPEPVPTDPPAPEPTDPPAPEPTPEEPPAGLPVIGPILELLSAGSAQQ
jgi:hypothetical protein